MAVLMLDGSPFDATAHPPLEDNGDEHYTPTDADKLLCASENMLEAELTKERVELLKQSGRGVPFQFRRPKDILRRTIVQPYQLDEVPPCMGSLAQHYTNATGHDQSGVIVSATVAAASMVDDRCRLEVSQRSNWYQSARLWAVLIGNPSTGKSPSIGAAVNPIRTIHSNEIAQWMRETQGMKEADRPPMPALFTSDTTVQALQSKLRHNQQGILMLTEEFDTWIGAIDAADRGEAAGNRGQWLQLYDGGPFHVDRVGRGSFLVPNWSASVLAAGTPEGLRSRMRSLPEDGLIQRFIPAIMQSPNFDANGDARPAMAEWARWIEAARQLTHGVVTTVRMSASTQGQFEAERKSYVELSDAASESSSAFASHIGKYPGMLARIALTFHLFSGRGLGVEIQPDTMDIAIRFMRRVRKHAHAMYEDVLGASPAWALARALARSLAADDTAVATISRNWMSQHCAQFRKAEDRVRMEAVRILEDADWLEPKLGRSYSGWSRHWTVNEQIAELFGREGESWRKRRAFVKEAIGDTEED